MLELNQMTTIINTDKKPKQVVLVTRELIELAPGEKIEFDGDIELVNYSHNEDLSLDDVVEHEEPIYQ